MIVNYFCEDIIILGLHTELYYPAVESQNTGYLYNMNDSYFENKIFIGHI